MKTLKVKAEKEHERFPGAFDIEAIRKVTEIGDFDDLYIAKIFGFTDKVDYYRKTGSKWWIPMIRVPAIAINARDDPFIRESSLPTADDIGPTAPVRTIYHEYGGHGGFSFEDKDSYVHYGPANPDEKLSDNEQQFQIPSYGWLAHEMARVIDHIHYHSFLMYSNLKEQSNAATENSKGGYFPASATELIRSGNANNSI